MKSSDRLIRCFRLVSLLAGLVSIAAANPAFDQWVDAFTAEWVRAGGGGGGGGGQTNAGAGGGGGAYVSKIFDASDFGSTVTVFVASGGTAGTGNPVSAGTAGGNTVSNNYLNSSNPVQRAKIMLNGNDRFAERNGTYFSLVQPYQHHENTPDKFHEGINVYSFALKPEDHQPSGTLNMSRIDTAVLNLTMDASVLNGQLFVYATNYNVLRILSGMGGLAYSN